MGEETNNSEYKGDDRPVTNCTMLSIANFIQKLNSLTGKKYRLPTIEEWTWAAMGAQKNNDRSYFAGAQNLSELKDYACFEAEEFKVGKKKPNEIGLYDMQSPKSCILSDLILKKELKTVDKEIALQTIQIASKYPKACCSDEFFLLAEQEIPKSEYYGNFSQLDDGVGSLRTIMDDFDTLQLPNSLKEPLKLCIACSVAATSAFEYISEKLNKIENLSVEVNPVKSTYWGKNITVAGLITSEDLINSIKFILFSISIFQIL